MLILFPLAVCLTLEDSAGNELIGDTGEVHGDLGIDASCDLRRCAFATPILAEKKSSSASRLDRGLSWTWFRCCSCWCMKAGLGLMVGVAPVSCTIKTSPSFSGVDIVGSSPIEDTEDWDRRVDFVVQVETDELDWFVRWLGPTGRVVCDWYEEGEGSSPIASPAAINLLTPCTPSLIPSSIAPPCPLALVFVTLSLPALFLSNPRLTIFSHFLFTVTVNKVI